MYAFKDGVTILNQDNLNSFLALQPFSLIYEGTQRAAKTGSGVTENSLASYSYAARFTLTGSTEIGRVELEVDKDGTGADLIVQIRSGMDPVAGNDGTILKQVVVPKEFIPDPKAYWSVPIDLVGLTSGGQYWLVVIKNGDATNKVDWVGEASQDGSYPAYYRAGDSGVWTANNALHFKVFSGETGKVKHGFYLGTAYTLLVYTGSRLDKIYRYLSPVDGPDGGIRDIMQIVYSGSKIKGGVV